MLIYLKSIDQSVNNLSRFVNKFDVKFTTDPKDAILYALKNYYSSNVKIGDIILERSLSKHNFDLFCITSITYKKNVTEKVPGFVINPDGSEENSLTTFEKIIMVDFEEKIRIEVKLDKYTKKCNGNIQKIKNLLFKLNLFFC